MRHGKSLLLILTAIFILGEILFYYLILDVTGDDLLGAVFLTIIFLLFILLFAKRFTWAKWTLSILLIASGITRIIDGIWFEGGLFYVAIGLYDVFFGIAVHKLKALEVFRKLKDEATLSVENVQPIVVGNRGFIADGIEFRYPLLVKRYKALFIDGMLLMTVLITVMIISADSEQSTTIMISSGVILSLAYEPILTAYSRTIGQRFMKIRVGRQNRPNERISLLNAYLRWFVKGLLGWLSFLTIHFNPEHRAIHDLASDSVMISED